MPGRDREVEESHAQSASRSTRGRSAKIRASVVTTLFFCVFFLRVSWSFPRERRLVVVGGDVITAPWPRPRLWRFVRDLNVARSQDISPPDFATVWQRLAWRRALALTLALVDVMVVGALGPVRQFALEVVVVTASNSIGTLRWTLLGHD